MTARTAVVWYYKSTSQIGFANVVILQKFRGIAGHGNGAGFQNIGTVCNGKRHLGVLFDKENGNAGSWSAITEQRSN